jgi:hypothetical protein
MPLLEDLIEAAKELLVKDRHLIPVFFLAHDEELVFEPTPMSMFDKVYGNDLNLDDTKTRDTFLVGGMAKGLGANRVIMIWDAALRTVNPQQFPSGYSSLESPLTYPKSMRTECIIINEVFLPSGKDNTIIVLYKGGDGEPVEFLPENNIFKQAGAHYKSRFTEIVLDGYNKARSIV